MTAQIIPFQRPKRIQPVCSFCKRGEAEVPKLFGNGMDGQDLKAICSDCLQHATDRLKEDQ